MNGKGLYGGLPGCIGKAGFKPEEAMFLVKDSFPGFISLYMQVPLLACTGHTDCF